MFEFLGCGYGTQGGAQRNEKEVRLVKQNGFQVGTASRALPASEGGVTSME